MSGQDVGTRIGAVLGFYAGGPARVPCLAMVSGMPGGLFDPEVIEELQPTEGESA